MVFSIIIEENETMKMENAMKKNDVVTVTIEDLTYEGLGVGKVDGYPLFIENALIGERVVAHVLKVNKNYGFAKVKDYLSTSEDRVQLVDEVGLRIGTMSLQHMSYPSQLRFKKRQVEQVLERIAKMPEIEVRDTLGMDYPYEYRNKAQIPVRKYKGQLETGFFRKNTHDLVPVEKFYIQHPEIDEAILIVRNILRHVGVKPYDEKNHSGNLRHIVIRRGTLTKELMIILVTRTKKLFGKERIISEIISQLPETVSIIQNVHEERSNVILGKETIVLYGKDQYRDRLLGLDFMISSKSFYQVNTTQTEVLYNEALKAANLKGDEVVIDAYCGIGTISLALAKKAKQVYAMEIVPDAIEMAKQNAWLNQQNNVHFEVGAAEYWMPQWKKDGLQPDVIVVDPPRKGLDAGFIEAAIAVQPKRIVYVSCNPATMARDLIPFDQAGYTIEYVQPVDMFPQTTHVECVVLLERK